MSDLSPAMKQYVDLKAQYPDCILFFRMGDFYEMFFEDAVLAAKLLDITLTTRNKSKDDSIPLCGVPYHAANGYIARLIERGYKVAVCEQMEDPRQAKGVVKRDVVRVVTPGLVVDPDNLEAKDNNFLAALWEEEGRLGLAFVDISTGEFRVAEYPDLSRFLSVAGSLALREILAPETFPEEALARLKASGEALRINRYPAVYFDRTDAQARLQAYFPQALLAEVGLPERTAILAAAGAVLRYVEETQKERLGHINRLEEYRSDACLVLDEIARRNLELFETLEGGKKKGSLLSCLDETRTAMGGRRLRWWLAYPLVDPAAIRERLSAVATFKEDPLLRERFRRGLDEVFDLERLAGRIAMKVANARDLGALKASLDALPLLRRDLEGLTGLEAQLLQRLHDRLDPLPEIAGLIGRAIADEPPLTIREGGMIREGYDEALDALIALSRDGKQGIAALEAQEKARTGINSLKVGFNSVFGYYIEVTKANAALVPDDYIRKQTLVNAERYINQALKDYEYAVLNAEERRRAREYDLFCEVRDRIGASILRIQDTASAVADLDCLAAMAEAAERHDYVCPVVDDSDILEIVDGRHPVVERMLLSGDRFVPNDVRLDGESNRFLVITGPNMAGKSTYIRQVALITILAQMGSFVPAARARIGLVDRIFTRIGASDNLARGQSTFMVEMSEVANVLKHATARSLVILDEVGRGTSTFDGLSIAWAVAEHLHDKNAVGARTLFATHYHQLTELALTLDGVKNYNIAVREWGDRIIFLRKIMEGGTSRSYGIQVGKLAGLPDAVIDRAKEILDNVETGELDRTGHPRLSRHTRTGTESRRQEQVSLFAGPEELLADEIRDLDVERLTPLEALTRLAAWKERLREADKKGRS